MVKREGDLWHKVVSMENLTEAYLKAKRGKGSQRGVINFEKDVPGNLKKIQDLLMSGDYRTSEYRRFNVYDSGKERTISSLPFFPDRIIHWAVILPTHHIFMRNFISQTYAAIPGRGTHLALKTLKTYLRDPDAKYCLKIDVRKFFDNMDKDILMHKLERRIKDRQVLTLFSEIVYGYRMRGIPIGNYTSQYFANLYLSDVDHFFKEKYRCKFYLRYMDDIIVLGWSKPWLRRVLSKMSEMLAEIGLEVKSNWQIFPISDRGVNFVGYRSFSDYTLLRKRTKNRMKRKMTCLISKMETDPPDSHDLGAWAAYSGVMQWCDSYRLSRRTIFKAETMIDSYARHYGERGCASD